MVLVSRVLPPPGLTGQGDCAWGSFRPVRPDRDRATSARGTDQECQLYPAEFRKGISVPGSPLRNQSPTSVISESDLAPCMLISYLNLNQQTAVYSFIGAKLNKQLQEGYSYKNLQHKFNFCLYLQNGLIKYPLILIGLFHNTLHTLILAMLIAPFVYYLKSWRFHFCHYVDSSAFTSMDEISEHPGLSVAPWLGFLGPAQKALCAVTSWNSVHGE